MVGLKFLAPFGGATGYAEIVCTRTSKGIAALFQTGLSPREETATLVDVLVRGKKLKGEW